jgi:hypothetical protein
MVPIPLILSPLAIPTILRPMGAELIGPTKSCRSEEIEMLAPESQMMGNQRSFFVRSTWWVSLGAIIAARMACVALAIGSGRAAFRKNALATGCVSAAT